MHSQHNGREILGIVDDVELWAAAKGCSFTQLVAQLPDKHRRQELMDYATALEAAAARIS